MAITSKSVTVYLHLGVSPSLFWTRRCLAESPDRTLADGQYEECPWEHLCSINTLRPRQNGHHFPDDIFKCIFLNENVWISNKISLKFVPKGPINNIPALVQIMAWRRPGDKPLSEPMVVWLPTHICVTLPQWVNVGNTRKIQCWLISLWTKWPPFCRRYFQMHFHDENFVFWFIFHWSLFLRV